MRRRMNPLEQYTVVPSGCWLWQRSLDGPGYGVVRLGGRHRMGAHRWFYEHFVGPIPDGLQLDHLCFGGIRRCVNPEHLEPVTRHENILRGTSMAAINAVKTHCKRGHAFTPENTYVKPTGSRQCRTCHREARAEARLSPKPTPTPPRTAA